MKGMSKKTVEIQNATVSRPVIIGAAACFFDGKNHYTTSPVVDVRESAPNRMMIETLNSIYLIRTTN